MCTFYTTTFIWKITGCHIKGFKAYKIQQNKWVIAILIELFHIKLTKSLNKANSVICTINTDRRKMAAEILLSHKESLLEDYPSIKM